MTKGSTWPVVCGYRNALGGLGELVIAVGFLVAKMGLALPLLPSLANLGLSVAAHRSAGH